LKKSFYFILSVCLLSSFLKAASNPPVSYKRVSLLDISVKDYKPFEGMFSYLDVGISRKEDSQKPECDFLSPQVPSGETWPWSPFDFYTNVRSDAEQKQFSAELGSSDVFFTGDDHNRNASTDSRAWTRKVTSNLLGSIDFLEPKKGKGWFSFRLKFTRNKLKFDGLIAARTWEEKGECKAKLFLCTKKIEKQGELNCESGGWTRSIDHVEAFADKAGGTYDYWNGTKDAKLKNDIWQLKGHVLKVNDENGGDKGEEFWDVLAKKE
jgi:hypothetical protein